MAGVRRRMALALGAAAVGGGVVVADTVTGEATGQSRGAVSVSAEQLRINQRISPAAVRRSDEGLALLARVRARPAVVTVRIYQASNPGNSEDAPST